MNSHNTEKANNSHPCISEVGEGGRNTIPKYSPASPSAKNTSKIQVGLKVEASADTHRNNSDSMSYPDSQFKQETNKDE